MRKDHNTDVFYVMHIKECISRIESFIPESRNAFLEDLKSQDAILRNLQILAESTQRLSTVFKESYPQIHWAGLSGLRNVLVHGYLGIDPIIIWDIIEKDLPELKSM